MNSMKKRLQTAVTAAIDALGRWPTPPSAARLQDAIATAVMEQIEPLWASSRQAHATGRRAYYLSAEYLVGRLIGNNLLCLGLTDSTRRAMEAAGLSPEALEEVEDAALGNGGLGRLAACFLDSAATAGLPLDGYGLRYRYGLFRQSFETGFQRESPDDWSREGDPWSVRRAEEAVTVRLGNDRVLAVPYDMPILGYDARHISTLRLWQGEPENPFDFAAFSRENHAEALAAKNRAENLSRVLYPGDSGRAGKVLRLSQQYFLASASLQDALRRFEKQHGRRWERLAESTVFQLNDTHPVIAIPELMDLLLKRGATLTQAESVARRCFCYTNHTVMPEALEIWELAVVEEVCPHLVPLLKTLAEGQIAALKAAGVAESRWPRLLFLQEGRLHMAYLAAWFSYKINGVAPLHTELLRQQVLTEFHALAPEKLLCVTNGITQRRWLALCNPALSRLLTEKLGSDRWFTQLDALEKLKPLEGDRETLEEFLAVKQQCKNRLTAHLLRREGLAVNPEALFDVQIKRLHEYKRQLLNALCILELYFRLREGSLTDFHPTVFLFGAKAAPGYTRAKAIIKLIHEIGALIRRDEAVSPLLQVVFVTDYSVSYAEKIIPAADVSVQISTAGTEASGTGNMKLMLNGAVTLGTYDGANIEIAKAVGEDACCIFGARVEGLRKIEGVYTPKKLYAKNPSLRRCLDALTDGTLDDGETGWFRELADALLVGANGQRPDPYYVLLDFDEFLQARLRLNREFSQNRLSFAAKQWRGICSAGYFSSDRAVAEYAQKIWRLPPSKASAQ